jgi:hypothetical protein
LFSFKVHCYISAFSSSILNRFTVQGALRAGAGANPPLNMHRALIFSGTFVLSAATLVFLVRGKQARKERDEEMQDRSRQIDAAVGATKESEKLGV